MTDERIDALIRRLDVTSDPDPEFVRSTYAALLPRARAARVSDASRIGRLARDLRLVVAGARWPSTTRPVGMVGLVVLLILATVLALAIVGARCTQTIQNGPLIVSIQGELQAIDVVDGSVRTILPPGDDAKGVSRSPDGRLVAFWTIGGGRSHLYVVGVDGQHRRELASDLSLGWAECHRRLVVRLALPGDRGASSTATCADRRRRCRHRVGASGHPGGARRPRPVVVPGRPLDRLRRRRRARSGRSRSSEPMDPTCGR